MSAQSKESRGVPVWVWFVVANAVVLGVVVGGLIWFQTPPKPPVAKQPAKSKTAIAPKAIVAAPTTAGATTALKPVGATSEPVNATPGQTNSPPPGPLSWNQVVEAVNQGIVLLSCRDSEGDEISIGSGFVVDARGLVATNFHVLDLALSIEARFQDGRTQAIKGCRAWDENSDLAILEFEQLPQPIQVLPLGTGAQLKVTAAVMAIGHPSGFQFTHTTGTISSVRKTGELPEDVQFMLRAPAANVWLQTNAAISAGSSGGPLLDNQGRVIGINTWIAGGQNLGFALDASHIADLLTRLQPEAVALKELTGPSEQLYRLAAEFNQQRAYLMQSLISQNKANRLTDEQVRQEFEKHHPALEFAPKIFDLADKYRGKPVARDALISLCEIGAARDCPLAIADSIQRTANRLWDDHLDEPRLYSLILKLGTTRLESMRDFLRKLSERDSDRQLQAAALYSLGISLQSADQPEGQTALHVEGVALLERVVRDFSDVEYLLVMNDNLVKLKLAGVIEPMLFELKHLAIGRTPLEIAGKDKEGAEFRLSDYRGKVVVLDFWADWCPFCREMYPLERELVSKHANAPFALLGVNCDDRPQHDRVVKSGDVTWRNWLDGKGGPIAQQWQIESYPTLFVLDHRGVICYRDVRGPELEAAINELLVKATAEASASPQSSPPQPAAAAIPVVAAAAAAPADADLRTWTSRDGKTVTLRFLEQKGDKIHLRNDANKQEYELPLSRFSDEDQRWVKQRVGGSSG